MKRSRYSATMSRWAGSSNQSRERKRRLGVRSEAMRNDALRGARYVNAHTAQAAGSRLLLALLVRKTFPRGGDVERAQVFAAECSLGDVGHRHGELGHFLAVRRIAVHAPAAVEAGPDVALRIGDRPSGWPSPAPMRAKSRRFESVPSAARSKA